MAERMADNTWQENPADIIVLANRSANNFILDLPTGRYRLGAGLKMRTLKSISGRRAGQATGRSG